MTEEQLDNFYNKCNIAPITGFFMQLKGESFFITDVILPINKKRLVFKICKTMISAEDIVLPENLEMKYNVP